MKNILKLVWALLILLAGLSSQAFATPDVGVCLPVLAAELKSKNKSFELDNGERVTKDELCHRTSESTGAEGSGHYGIGGGSAKYSSEKVDLICSNSYTKDSNLHVRQLFQDEMGDNQLTGFKSCLDTVSRSDTLEVSKVKIIEQPGERSATDQIYGARHYTFSITFRWLPWTIKPSQIMTLVKTHETGIGDCGIPTAAPRIQPYPDGLSNM